ncbi:MAG: hypothetical protein JW993_15775 [Sedimentisphaerales bacterium]|nr:hypothetical protein [Sedimentisphaerales bacterium]
MTYRLSPLQSAAISALWVPAFIVGVFLLAGLTGMELDDRPALYALLVSVPVLSGAFCRQLRGVLYGAFGLGVGMFAVATFVALFVRAMNVDWTRVVVIIPLVVVLYLVFCLPAWWGLRRLRRQTAAPRVT